MGQIKPGQQRPLSPHLQIYRPLFTMMMSIFHRLTGIGLYFGALIVIWWLVAAATGPEYFDWVTAQLNSMPAKIILLLACWAFFHHMLGGIRHFIWDFGKGFELSTVELLARANLIGSIALTALVWAYI